MRGKTRRRPGWRAALLAVGAMTAGLLLTAPQQASAGPPNLLTNPGFETAGAPGADMPSCWEKSGWGDNDFSFTTVADAHSGTKAMKVALTRRVSGDRKAMVTENAACAPTVTPGKQYDLSAWYKSDTPDVSVTVFRHDATAGWQYWTDLANPPVSAAWARTQVRTPAVPPGTDKITWGLSVYGAGVLTSDDYAVEEVGATPPQPGCTGTADQCAKGSWEVIPAKNPVRSMHAVVLKNGKVLLIAGSGNDISQFNAGTFTSAVYDPANGSFKTIPTPSDMFCSGHVQLSDGRVLVMSGNKGYPSADGKIGYQGLKDSYVFDPATETYTRTNDLNGGHWYPSATVLGNGDVITFGGLKEDSTGNVTAEKFSAAQNKWLPMNEVNQTWSYWGLYPSMVLMQDGRLFYTGSHTFGNGTQGSGSSIYDYNANTVTDVPGLRNKDQRDESASVLLPPAQDQRVLTIGGGNNETNPAANRLTDLIDLKAANPVYTAGPDIPQGLVDVGAGKRPQTGAEGKMYPAAVLLPDGKVLETGGGLHDRADPVYEASFFDPVTNTYQAGLPTDPIPRTYHSGGFLLPDGRVMTVGDNPGNGTYNNNVSIYTPPYLFKGARPQLTSVINTQWLYGDTQRITVDRPIVKAELIRPAAVTHSSDPNQRFVDLPMSVVNGTTIDLNVTTNPNLAPPGWYMLFGVDANGVPSVATWVHLGGAPSLAQAAVSPTAHVHDFADAPQAAPKANPAQRDSVPVAPGVAGCDRHYGTVNVCVPTRFPAEVKETTKARCDWLAAHKFPPRLKINGSDPLRLDPHGNGYACT
ncbi:galactose oxidase-like domain-containing protein [Streptomyces sp. NPDC059411]|uniref:galactose oxidase-like domain-containing protein n=1 Tax=Streptomyces sp. NPDC059411 TaxID=3346825 RepID=UPI0036B2F82E